MNKLKKYIYMGCALLSISSVIAGGSYAYSHYNSSNYYNESLYADKANSVQSEDYSKYEKKGTVVNVETILNVRQEPSVDSPVDHTLDNGEIVNIVDEKEGWYEIEKDNDTGYVKSDYVEQHDQNNEIKAVPLDNKIVIDEKTNPDLQLENLPVDSNSETIDRTKSQSGETKSNDIQKVSVESQQSEAPKGKLINVELTAYCNDEQCSGNWGGTTTMGTQTRVGVIAAPSNISLGSQLYIPDLLYYKNDGVFNVEDRGGAVKMKDDGTYVIDVWFPTYEEVEQFGRVKTTAYILE